MAFHEYTIKLKTSPSHVQSACDGTYLALPLGHSSIGVWSLEDVTCKPLELEGHSKKVTALRFNHTVSSTLLCSGGDDYVIIWNVEKARSSYESGQQIRGRVIATALGSIQALSFSPNGLVVAACVGKEVIILDSYQERVDTILEGHYGNVNCAEFSPHYTSTLVSASDDRTFKVWDISEGSLLYQSTIISSSPFISLTMSHIQETFAVGTADGQVRVYDLTDGNGFRCLHHLDIEKLSSQIKDLQTQEVSALDLQSSQNGPKTISSRPSWQKLDTARQTTKEPDDETDADCEIGASILNMTYLSYMSDESRAPTPARLSFLNQPSVVGDLQHTAPVLVIGTTGAIVLVNARTLEPAAHFSFKDPIPSHDMIEDCSKTISLAGSIILAPFLQTDQIWVVTGGLFHNDVNILKFNLPTKDEINNFRIKLANKKSKQPNSTVATEITSEEVTYDQSEPSQLTVLSGTPLLPNSPLKAELVLKPKDGKISKKPQKSSLIPNPSHYGALNNKGRISDDRPITYHSSVKSSGYSKESPRRTMFQPRTSSAATKASSFTKSKSSIGKEYPVESKPPSALKSKLDATDKPTAINAIRFSNDGQNIACALGNHTGQVFKMPLTGKGCAFAGHAGVVTSANWSRDSNWLITSGEDRAARVWSSGLPDPVMTIATENNNFGVDKDGGVKSDRDNMMFKRAVKFAQFYFMDKFILLCSGNSFNMYKYHLDLTKSDIKRYLSSNRYKLVKSFEMEKSQQLTAFSAVNGFHSYITLCAGTNKSIEVFDMNVARSVRVIPNAHERQIHCICQNQGSPYVSHVGSTYDLFLTSAASDCIRLWDLRSNRCVSRYEGHCNRTQPCGLSFSPCSRYIATGSEDRSAYLFDIRTGTYIHKLTGHTDTVSDVAFHPLYAQLMTSTLDGKLRLFVEP